MAPRVAAESLDPSEGESLVSIEDIDKRARFNDGRDRRCGPMGLIY